MPPAAAINQARYQRKRLPSFITASAAARETATPLPIASPNPPTAEFEPRPALLTRSDRPPPVAVHDSHVSPYV